MKRCVVISLAALLAMGLAVGADDETKAPSISPASEPGSRPSPKPAEKAKYFLIPVKGDIGKEFTAAKMKTYLGAAAKLKPAAVVLEIESYAGATDEADKIVDLMIAATDFRYVAFVHDALSPSSAVALACGDIYMADVGRIGGSASLGRRPDGKVIDLAPDVEEKMRLLWQATLKKAADFSGRPAVLAEAIADATFAVTATRKEGKLVFEKDGSGELVKTKGRCLTLTAKEAVLWEVARDMADGLPAVGAKLGMADWTALKADVPAPTPPPTPAALDIALTSPEKVLASMPKDIFPKLGVKWSGLNVSAFNDWAVENLHGKDCQTPFTWGDAIPDRFRGGVYCWLCCTISTGGRDYFLALRLEFDKSTTLKLAGIPRGKVVTVQGKIKTCRISTGVYEADGRGGYYQWSSTGAEAKPALFFTLEDCQVVEKAKTPAAVDTTRPAPTSKPASSAPALSDEEKAQALYEGAMTYVSTAKAMGNDKALLLKARQMLQAVVSDYPKTKAAQKAAQQLQALK
ncbi:MAG: hypothetical protein ACE15C_09720 [Phycisphaerae bacterium]